MAEQFTRDGTIFGDAVSTMQKSIRRGLVDESIYWVDELFHRYHFYTTRRLMIICIEDIGLADLMLVERALSQLSALYAALSDKANGLDRHDMRYMIAGIVRQMAEAKKSREADEFQHHVQREMRCGLIPVQTDYPTYEEAIGVLFKHIEARDEKLAFTAAIELNNGYVDWMWRDLVVYASIHYDDLVVTNMVIHLRNFVRDTMDARKGEYEPLCLGLALLVMLRSDQSQRHIDVLIAQDKHRMAHPETRREVPDYALDLHTSRGKRMGRYMEHFDKVGSHLENEGYKSRYWMCDPELGSASVLADNLTKVTGEWACSNKAQKGEPRIFRPSHHGKPVSGEDEETPNSPATKQPTFELKF